MATGRKKILQLQNNYNVMSSDLAEQIIKALPEDEYEVTTAFLYGKSSQGQPVSAAPTSIYFDFSKKQLKGIRRWFSSRKVLRYCQEHDFDAVICHRFKPVNMVLGLSKKLKTKAFISIAHGFGDYDRSYRAKVVDKHIDKRWCFVGVSEPVKQHLQEKVRSLSAENTVAINNAIDIDAAINIHLSREDARKELGLPDNRFIIGTIGRLVEIKGHAVMIDAVAKLRKSHPNVMVAIIGGGEEEDNLRQQITAMGLEDIVCLLGSRPEAIKYVKAFDVFALPSFTEGLPLALLEGMSGGIPVIGSDIDTIKPYIEGLGQVCKVKNAASLAEKMKYYLDLSPEELKVEGGRHLAALRERHSIEDFRTSYRNLLGRMLNQA